MPGAGADPALFRQDHGQRLLEHAALDLRALGGLDQGAALIAILLRRLRFVEPLEVAIVSFVQRSIILHVQIGLPCLLQDYLERIDSSYQLRTVAEIKFIAL